MSSNTGKLLTAFLGDLVKMSLGMTEAFLLSGGSVRRLARNMHMLDREYHSAMQSLQRNGYVKKRENNQFLITPKGIQKAKKLLVLRKRKKINPKEWDDKWRIVIFDIPDGMRAERDMFRSALKRYGFLGLQKSVFISPDADFEGLAALRKDFGIEKYVTFLVSEVSVTEDDTLLKKKFGL